MNKPIVPHYKNKDLKNIKGEIWKDIPGLEGYGMISNFGRVKKLAYETYDKTGTLRHYKERVQAQKIVTYFNQFKKDKRGHLSSRIQIEGVCYSLSVGRIVYYCFVETFDLSDKSIYITYKDYNALNPTPENLLKTDLSGLQQHIIKAGRKDLHFGHSAENQKVFSKMGREVNIKKVSQYDMDGNYLSTYESLSEAAEKTGISTSGISAATNGRKLLTAGGFIWRFGASERKVAVKEIHKAIRATKGAPVTRYDLSGKMIKTYYNIARAADELSLPRRTLSMAVNGKILVYAGFIWRKGEKQQIKVDKELHSLELRSGFIVSKYGLDGKKIKTFRSVSEAAKHAGVQGERINAMAIRDDLLLKGFIWRYGDALSLSKEELTRIKANLSAEKHKGITQYNIHGKRLAFYASMTEASKDNGVARGGIQGSVDGHKITAGGFIWRRGKGKERLNIPATPRPIGHKLSKAVVQFNQKGKLIDKYPNIAEASRKTGLHVSTIGAAIRTRRTAGGFLWEKLSI